MKKRTKIEAGSAVIGAVIGAVGAVMINPTIIGVGIMVAGAATVARILDRHKQQQSAGQKSRVPGSVAACL
jgi:hypothetical protein